jgi:two-component system sensor histidine kinase MtrB
VPTNFGPLEPVLLVPLTNEGQRREPDPHHRARHRLALVILLGVVAGLVTRMVVSPVRVAARTAQRLSAGLLDQRMKVEGEDDLALLAAAFNQMAANLQRQIVRLEDMSRLQRRFTSDVSHELRTPLTTVRMAADLIFAERDGFDPAVARSAELLQAELDRFENLLTDLLEISRFDAGFAALDAEHADLVPIVERIAERLSGLAERAGVTIELRLPDAPVIAEVDPRRVERVLRNLIGNAVEHGESKPVEVTMATDDAAVAITVRDHGVGLKPGEERWCSTGSGGPTRPARGRPAAPGSACRSASRTRGCTAAGWRRGACQVPVPVPAHAAGPGGRPADGAPLPLIPPDHVDAPGVETASPEPEAGGGSMRRFAMAALLAALVLSGCGIPDNSPVLRVEPGPSTGTSSGDTVTPSVPHREDADGPSSLVQNYLLAAAGSLVDAPARVKASYPRPWPGRFKPQPAVRVIHPIERPLNNPGSDEVSIKGWVLGTLDANGVLQRPPIRPSPRTVPGRGGRRPERSVPLEGPAIVAAHRRRPEQLLRPAHDLLLEHRAPPCWCRTCGICPEHAP